MVVGIFLVAAAIVDFSYEQGLTWWTIGRLGRSFCFGPR